MPTQISSAEEAENFRIKAFSDKDEIIKSLEAQAKIKDEIIEEVRETLKLKIKYLCSFYKLPEKLTDELNYCSLVQRPFSEYESYYYLKLRPKKRPKFRKIIALIIKSIRSLKR